MFSHALPDEPCSADLEQCGEHEQGGGFQHNHVSQTAASVREMPAQRGVSGADTLAEDWLGPRVLDSRAARGRKFDSARPTCGHCENLTTNLSQHAHVRCGKDRIDHQRIAPPPTQQRDQILASIGT
jgi:hypothetical protein